MFKGFQNTNRNGQFKGFPNLNFQMNNEAYGFSGCTFWLDAAYGLSTQTDLAAVSSWRDRIKGIEFVQATAGNQPRLISSDANFNNYPSIDMAWSTNRNLVSATGLLARGSIACVLRAGTIDNKMMIFLASGSTIQQFYNGGNSSAAITGLGVYDNVTPIMITTIEDTLPHIIIITGTEIVIDGVQQVTGSWAQTINYNTIGSSTARGNAIAEIFKFDVQFSSADCITLSDNINSKYAIY